MRAIFLSYRRDDTAGEAGRLSDTIRYTVGRGIAFRDVVDIKPGAHFDAVLERELGAVSVVLVLIGRRWLEELKRRLAVPETDYLRAEIATSLRTRKRTIPVLLQGAALPPAHELPDDLKPLVKCQAITLRDESWNSDVERLMDAIGRPFRWDLCAIRAVLVIVLVFVGVWWLFPVLVPDRSSDYGFIRVTVGSLLVAYALGEISVRWWYIRKRD